MHKTTKDKLKSGPITTKQNTIQQLILSLFTYAINGLLNYGMTLSQIQIIS